MMGIYVILQTRIKKHQNCLLSYVQNHKIWWSSTLNSSWSNSKESFIYKLHGNMYAVCNGSVGGCCQTVLDSSGEGTFPFWRCRVCRAVKTPIMALSQWPPVFFFRSVTQKPVIFQFQPQIWLFQMILCTIVLFRVRKFSIRCFYGTETALTKTKNYILTQYTIILDQNVVSHLITPYFFFLLPDVPGCGNRYRCPIHVGPMSILYMSVGGGGSFYLLWF